MSNRQCFMAFQISIKNTSRSRDCFVFNCPSIIKISPGNSSENCRTYEIPCHNCNEKYFGETGRSLE